MAIQISSELLDGCVLALLKTEDYYGYALTQKLQAIIPVSESTLYPVLRRLKKNGWVTTYDQAYQGRNRRYYQLTTNGTQQLNIIQQDWHHFYQAINTLLKGDAPA
ncbi:PadR family transcriptional regulator [Lactiplantibacillus mudanjiangensis]|uniref:PadR family transcriptional regulator [Lactobacillus sp.] n=1 Tax=Lactiplantibacillus mudanjiangensis TaxID=1296538 RepID=A0A660DYT7_9LACO|nr:PadR family transcriptional regulator [Lactiplantibacillus mudanjiangensis]VDG20322.1 PadR family transcriptional regulator [Lactobacillus sp.] [Lactiplantibacillus mudanjiangensis]VDG23986.1 PadR family transcriptional regulator [Lactobacillus sp.] [Lactiplantibacillus mudanjiangensis]VDG27213.1 PadR family transcriptional regulator [Lactobacillus sp.] [Lactiplantibacillus mudanjiangensis]VDG33926.1 PadR family transcriptional regulator [Lactobacillus sp.] [Lactiplantibacillus mudanjiangens